MSRKMVTAPNSNCNCYSMFVTLSYTDLVHSLTCSSCQVSGLFQGCFKVHKWLVFFHLPDSERFLLLTCSVSSVPSLDGLHQFWWVILFEIFASRSLKKTSIEGCKSIQSCPQKWVQHNADSSVEAGQSKIISLNQRINNCIQSITCFPLANFF